MRSRPKLRAFSRPTFHWSKEYVEHLRAVHFALTAASMALLILALSPPASEYLDAKEELASIQKIRREDMPPIILQKVEGALRAWHHSDSVSLLSVSLPREPLPRQLADGSLVGVPSKNVSLHLHIPRPDAVVTNMVGDDFMEPPYPHSFRSLAEFREFWNRLRANRYVKVSSTTAESTLAVAVPMKPPSFIFQEATKIQVVFDDPSKLPEVYPHDVYLDPCPKDLKTFLSSLQTNCAFTYVASIPGQNMAVFMPVEQTYDLEVDPQSALFSINDKWVPGEFSVSFGVLDRLTSGIQDLPLDRLRTFLETKEMTETRGFEVLGVKFPAESTKWAGLLVLLGLQLYFWVHLRERMPFLKTSDPGWDVAWIGVYRSLTAQILLFASTVVLPTLAAIAIGLRPVTGEPLGTAALQLGLHWLLSSSTTLSKVGFMIATGIIVVVSLMTWHALRELARAFQGRRGARGTARLRG